MMQRRMQQLPFRGINQEFVDKHIDEIIKDIVPKGTNLYKKPRTASEAVEIMEEYLEGEGRVSEGFLKRKKYLKEKAA